MYTANSSILRGESRGRVQGVRTPSPPSPEMTCGFLLQLVFCKKKTMWFIGAEVEQETSAPPPKKNLGPTPDSVKQRKNCPDTGHMTLILSECFWPPLFQTNPISRRINKLSENLPSLSIFTLNIKPFL